MGFNGAPGDVPANFTMLGGNFSGYAQHDVNIVPVGTTTMTNTGGVFGELPHDVHHWDALGPYGDVRASGGAIPAGTAFTFPPALNGQPGWVCVNYRNAAGERIGGGQVVFEPAGTPWPVGLGNDIFVAPRLGLPCNRMSVAAAENPSAANNQGYWGGGNAASTAFAPDYLKTITETPSHIWNTSWAAIDPVRRARLTNLINFPYYFDDPSQNAGVTATAARYVGLGCRYEGRNEPNGVPDASYVPQTVAFARAVWAGDPAAHVTVPCPVSINRAARGRLTAYFTGLKAALTTGEWAKIEPSWHDYNLIFNDLRMADASMTWWDQTLTTFGLADRHRFITEHDAFEGAHYGDGQWTHQAVRFAGANMVAQAYGVDRESLYLFYLRAHGHPDYFSWVITSAGHPYPVVAWLLTQERETRRGTFAERHAAGDDARWLLSLRYTLPSGAGVVQAKVFGRSQGVAWYQLTGASLPATATVVSFEGRESTVAVDSSGRVKVDVGAMPTFLRTPAGVTATLIPTVRSPIRSGMTFIENTGTLGTSPWPLYTGSTRQSLIDDLAAPTPDARYSWQAGALFAPGQMFGATGAPFTIDCVELACPIPRHSAATIVKAALQLRVGGSWVPATHAGQPVVIDEPLPYELAKTTYLEGTYGYYLGYDKATHGWVLDVDPTLCTGARFVVNQITYGEAPALDAFMAAPLPAGGHAAVDADTHAGFGTETPRLAVESFDVRGFGGAGGGGGGGGGGSVRWIRLPS